MAFNALILFNFRWIKNNNYKKILFYLARCNKFIKNDIKGFYIVTEKKNIFSSKLCFCELCLFKKKLKKMYHGFYKNKILSSTTVE